MCNFGGRPAQILLVEDNPGDARLVREALHLGKIRHELVVAQDGAEALAFLRRGLRANDAHLPDLVLLDLHLPRVGGDVVLGEIKADKVLGRIPVVVFTTSSEYQDIAASYGLHANAVVTKPLDLEHFIAAIHAIEDFWLGIAALPSME